MFCPGSPVIVATFAAAAAPAFGRSATNRAARISVSNDACGWPGRRLSVETRSLAASDVDNVARRAASSQGSTFMRANAERTLSRIPPDSSFIGANRKASYREVTLPIVGQAPDVQVRCGFRPRFMATPQLGAAPIRARALPCSRAQAPGWGRKGSGCRPSNSASGSWLRVPWWSRK